MRTRIGAASAALLLTTLALGGCAAAPSTSPAPSTTATSAAVDYCARMVTNQGGLDDRSFNQSSWQGLQKAQQQLGITAKAIVSNSETDLAPNVQQAVDTGCQYVLTVGWELADATAKQAKANPKIHFSIVDEQVDAPNVKSIVFDTAQASYLAGYLAAGVSKTGKVGTFGGDNQPPVTLFMDGFADGIAKYNQVHGTSVQLLGWNKKKQDGVFTGDYEDTNKGKVKTQGLIDQGADVIMPVAGQVGEGAAAAALDAKNVSLIWVDNDGYNTLPAAYKPILLTSVMKNTQDAVVSIIRDDLKGSFSNKSYIGTLQNGGVAIAPFHDLAGRVSPALSKELDGLKADIVAGTITVTSPSSPK